MTIQAIVSALYWLVLALMLVGAVLAKWLYGRLERHHPEVWRELGEPSLFLGASIRAQYRMSKFIRSGAYESLGDDRFNQVAWVGRVVTLVIVLLIFLAVVVSTYFRT